MPSPESHPGSVPPPCLCIGQVLQPCRYTARVYIKHGHIRDCNKTTDVRTTDSRTGIVPLNTTPSLSFPSSFFLRPSTYSFPSPCPSDTLRLFPSNASVHCLPANLSTTSLIRSPSPSSPSRPLLHGFFYIASFLHSLPRRASVFLCLIWPIIEREKGEGEERREPRPRFLLKSGGFQPRLAWSSAHEFPVTFRNTARILSME